MTLQRLWQIQKKVSFLQILNLKQIFLDFFLFSILIPNHVVLFLHPKFHGSLLLKLQEDRNEIFNQESP